MADFYHLMLIPRPLASEEQVEKKLNLAVDWFNYAPNCWILYTTANAKKLAKRFEPLVKPGGNLFVCKLDVSDRDGWITKELWTWLRKPR